MAPEKMTEVLRSQIDFPETLLITRETNKNKLRKSSFGPPAIMGSAWAKKLGKISTGYASGWMAFRGARRRRAVDKAFVLSDHADWKGFYTPLKLQGCENVITTHGYTEIFAQYLREKGWNARTEKTQYEVETPETAVAE